MRRREAVWLQIGAGASEHEYLHGRGKKDAAAGSSASQQDAAAGSSVAADWCRGERAWIPAWETKRIQRRGAARAKKIQQRAAARFKRMQRQAAQRGCRLVQS
jgi:hypothetical protein